MKVWKQSYWGKIKVNSGQHWLFTLQSTKKELREDMTTHLWGGGGGGEGSCLNADTLKKKTADK